MNQPPRIIAVAIVAVLAMSGGHAEDEVGDGNGPALNAGMLTTYDLIQSFDDGAFTLGMVQPMFMGQAQPASENLPAVVQRIEPVRKRLEARIAEVDRIVRLTEKQRKKLEVAAQLDLQQLADKVAAIRAEYVGRRVTVDLTDSTIMEEIGKKFQKASEDAGRCRTLIAEVSGPGSLLAKILSGTLDEPQTTTYKAVMDARRDRLWKAAVATSLARLDESLGLTQKQHDALAAALRVSPPSPDELFYGALMPSSQAAGLVAARLASTVRDNAEVAGLLDPRQVATVGAGMAANGFFGAGFVVAPPAFGPGMVAIAPFRAVAAFPMPAPVAFAEPPYFLGVQVGPVDDATQARLRPGEGTAGLLQVMGVADGSPAEAVGVKSGDVLLSANGTDLATREQLVRVVQEAGESEGDVTLVIERDGTQETVVVRPAKRPGRE